MYLSEESYILTSVHIFLFVQTSFDSLTYTIILQRTRCLACCHVSFWPVLLPSELVSCRSADHAWLIKTPSHLEHIVTNLGANYAFLRLARNYEGIARSCPV